MRQVAVIITCCAGIAAGCGGAQTPAAAPAEQRADGAHDSDAATGAARSASDPETTDAREAGNDGTASETPAERVPEAPAAPGPERPGGAPAASGDEDAVKEASEARITDKNIVISGKVLFETGKAKLKKVSYEVLDEVVFAMEKHPEIIKIQIVGHTDSDGDANANKRLSKRRAAAVMQYLIREGIEKERLSAVGAGEDVPIASNDTEEGKDKNRRVEFNIVERAKITAVTHSTSTRAPGKVKSKKATNDEIEALIEKEGLDKELRK